MHFSFSGRAGVILSFFSLLLCFLFVSAPAPSAQAQTPDPSDLLLCSAPAIEAPAIDADFVSVQNGLWHEPATWGKTYNDNPYYPGPGDSASVNHTVDVACEDCYREVGSLIVQPNGLLRKIQTVNIEGHLHVLGDLVNHGHITVDIKVSDDATVVNSGTIDGLTHSGSGILRIGTPTPIPIMNIQGATAAVTLEGCPRFGTLAADAQITVPAGHVITAAIAGGTFHGDGVLNLTGNVGGLYGDLNHVVLGGSAQTDQTLGGRLEARHLHLDGGTKTVAGHGEILADSITIYPNTTLNRSLTNGYHTQFARLTVDNPADPDPLLFTNYGTVTDAILIHTPDLNPAAPTTVDFVNHHTIQNANLSLEGDIANHGDWSGNLTLTGDAPRTIDAAQAITANVTVEGGFTLLNAASAPPVPFPAFPGLLAGSGPPAAANISAVISFEPDPSFATDPDSDIDRYVEVLE